MHLQINNKFSFVICCILTASILSDVVVIQVLAYLPFWFIYLKLLILMALFLYTRLIPAFKHFTNFTLILVVLIASQIVTENISKTSLWLSLFSSNTFVANIGSSILVKLINLIPVLCVLMLTLKFRQAFFANIGNLSTKADKIGWLGIENNQIKWGKLSVISAFLISFVTLLSTVITVTRFKLPDIGLFFALPIIISFALVNSLCEGLLYRSTILGTLNTLLPKNQILLAAAVYFGIAHYYGAPGGIIGAGMSCVLGWYLSRSMYETKGFVSSWIIHFTQDVVIFSLFWLVRNN